MYTRLGALTCQMFSLECKAKQCAKVYPHQEAASKSIFFFSKVTGAGDEVGWDFISRVQQFKVSFTGFCKDMSRVYQGNNKGAANFMSPNTFIGWVFSWLCGFRVDFRKQIDPWCGYNPKILACDGTHIGVAVRHMKLDHPVTKVDLPDLCHKPVHKR